MKTKTGLLLAVVALVLLLQPQAGAQGMRRGRGSFGGPLMAAYLGLTTDQVSQIKSLRASERGTTAPLMKELASYRQQLRAASQSTTPLNMVQLNTLAGQMAQLESKLTVSRTQMDWQVFNNVLTSDQQTKLVTFEQQMHERMQQRMRNRNADPAPGANP